MILIFIIIIFFIIIYTYNNNCKEKFIDVVPITQDTLKQNIYNIYTNDVNAIINLSKIANQIQNILTFNTVNMKGELKIYQYNNNNYLSFTKSQNIWTISNPQNNNDLLLSSSQDVMRLKSDSSGVVISEKLDVSGNLSASNISNLNLVTANKISIGTNNNSTLNINGDINISNNLVVNSNINITGSLEIPRNIEINNNLSINNNDFIQLYNDVQKIKKQKQINGIWITKSQQKYYWIEVYNDIFTFLLCPSALNTTTFKPRFFGIAAIFKITNYNTGTMEIIKNETKNTTPLITTYSFTNDDTLKYDNMNFTRYTSNFAFPTIHNTTNANYVTL